MSESETPPNQLQQTRSGEPDAATLLTQLPYEFVTAFLVAMAPLVLQVLLLAVIPPRLREYLLVGCFFSAFLPLLCLWPAITFWRRTRDNTMGAFVTLAALGVTLVAYFVEYLGGMYVATTINFPS